MIHAAHVNGVEKLMFLGSSCIYPKLAPQPLREDSMLTGPLEPTNEPYAIAKIAGIKMVEAYRSQYDSDFINVMPTNLYGRGDNYHPEYSHVVAALIRRFHEARVSGVNNVVVWGTGTPRREFLYVDDMADACVHLMKTYSGDELVNIGTGEDITIAEFARVVAATVGYAGEISFDASKPDGTPRKLLDVSRLAKLGWRASTSLEDGIRLAYQAYLTEFEMMARRASVFIYPACKVHPAECTLLGIDSAAVSFHSLLSRRRKLLKGDVMKLPRRQFLHLAAGAAMLPAVSEHRKSAKLSDASHSPDHRLYPRRLGGPDRATDGAMAFGTARSVIRHREPARRRHQHRHRGGPAGRAGWVHASSRRAGERHQRHALQQTQFQFPAGDRTDRRHHPFSERGGGEPRRFRSRRSPN